MEPVRIRRRIAAFRRRADVSDNVAPATKQLGDRMWAVATWSTPLLFQAVCGVFLAAMLVLGKMGFRDNDMAAEGHKVLTAAVVAAVVCVLVSVPFLVSRGRPALRGVGVGLATSAVIFLTGAAPFVYWLY